MSSIPPADKIIWDVGHQCYAHKLLTGRQRAASARLRQEDGICGFPNRHESEHDAFGTGHASTSISAALGFATARDLQGEDYQVVAVIGDGALTGGLAYEGLNNAGALEPRAARDPQRQRDVDLAQRRRALASTSLGCIRRSALQQAQEKTSGRPHRRAAGRRGAGALSPRTPRRALKNLIVPGMLFEELGFRYFGPIDGHDLRELTRSLRSVRAHARAGAAPRDDHKGKGFEFAENEPEEVARARRPSIRHRRGRGQAAPAHLHRALRRGLRGAGRGASRGRGDHRRDAGRHRADRVPAGVPRALLRRRDRRGPRGHLRRGAGQPGVRPVVAIYSTVPPAGVRQLVHDVAVQHLPVVFAMDRAGLVGEDGPTHNGVFDLATCARSRG